MAPEELPVTTLIGGVHEVQPPQQRIWRQLCSAQNVATPVDFRGAELQQLSRAPIGIAPDPAMEEREHDGVAAMHMPGLTTVVRSRAWRTEIAIASAGVVLIAAAIAANQAWLDRHFLPDFFIARETFVRTENSVRVVVALIGVALALIVRRPLANFLTRDPLRTFGVVLAVIASFGTAELMLRRIHLRAREEVPARKEPLRHRDVQLGWLFDPSRVGFQRGDGRRVRYAFDGNGYRVCRVTQRTDFDLPTVVFSGESMMVGEKLQWDETIPAQTASLLRVQSANIAVSGFALDQQYLRLTRELPRFRRPLAVVTLFAPSLFDRTLDDDRPHLGSHLVWYPPRERWRLTAIATRLLRYRSDADIERGIEVTQEVLRATDAVVHSRGAMSLFVVPQFGEETPRERELRIRTLDAAEVPYVLVRLDPSWRVRDDEHPDARGANAIAKAIAERLLKAGAFHAKRTGS